MLTRDHGRAEGGGEIPMKVHGGGRDINIPCAKKVSYCRIARVSHPSLPVISEARVCRAVLAQAGPYILAGCMK